MSKIPHIALLYFGAGDGTDSARINKDTVFLHFSMTDGDADLGNPQGGGQYDIYIRDMRYDKYDGYFFPDFDQSIENPKKGIEGECLFVLTSDILQPRLDSLHAATRHDTTYYDFYIVDRAGHQSNHITTTPIIMKTP